MSISDATVDRDGCRPSQRRGNRSEILNFCKQLVLYRRSRLTGVRRRSRPVAGLAIKSVERSRWRLRWTRWAMGIQLRLFDGWGWRAERWFWKTDWGAKMEEEVGGEPSGFCELEGAGE